jgi:hypothetical protein
MKTTSPSLWSVSESLSILMTAGRDLRRASAVLVLPLLLLCCGLTTFIGACCGGPLFSSLLLFSSSLFFWSSPAPSPSPSLLFSWLLFPALHASLSFPFFAFASATSPVRLAHCPLRHLLLRHCRTTWRRLCDWQWLFSFFMGNCNFNIASSEQCQSCAQRCWPEDGGSGGGE